MISRKSQRPHFTSNSSRFGGMGDINKPKIKIMYCHIQKTNIKTNKENEENRTNTNKINLEKNIF